MQCVVLLAGVVAALGGAAALECYSCNSKRDIGGVSIAASIRTQLRNFPPCEEFDVHNPQQKFVQKCPLLNDKGCMKVVDPTDSSNVLRTCFLLAKDECVESACHCTGNLCNGAPAAAASSLLLVAPALAALLRLR